MASGITSGAIPVLYSGEASSLPVLRNNGSYTHPSWLPTPLISMDHSRVQHLVPGPARRQELAQDGQRLRQHQVQRPTHEPDQMLYQEIRGARLQVSMENPNQFRLSLGDATVSGASNLRSSWTRNWSSLTRRQPSQAHNIQGMVYMTFLFLASSKYHGPSGGIAVARAGEREISADGRDYSVTSLFAVYPKQPRTL